MLGAPAVALIGGFYVAELLDVGREGAIAAAAAMIAGVIAANAFGLQDDRAAAARAGRRARGAAARGGADRAAARPATENWTPFAPHGWAAVGSAASVLMLSFIGWEAVSHLAGELPNPARQLPRAIFSALGDRGGAVPRAGGGVGRRARQHAVAGPARRPDGRRPRRDRPDGHRGARGAADDGDDEHVRRGGGEARGGAGRRAELLARPRNALALFAVVAAALLTPLAIDVLSLDDLIHATNAVFIAVYVTATAAGVRLLDGSARVAAAIAFVAVVIVFAFSGWFVLVPIAISSSLPVAALTTRRRRRSRARATTAAASAACS